MVLSVMVGCNPLYNDTLRYLKTLTNTPCLDEKLKTVLFIGTNFSISHQDTSMYGVDNTKIL